VGPSYRYLTAAEQFRKTVKTIDNPLLVVARPGTGKTLTIVRRIVYLIQQGARRRTSCRNVHDRAAGVGSVPARSGTKRKVFIGVPSSRPQGHEECRGDDFPYTAGMSRSSSKSLMKNSAESSAGCRKNIADKNFLEDADGESRNLRPIRLH
jgi:hypothetical protein